MATILVKSTKGGIKCDEIPKTLRPKYMCYTEVYAAVCPELHTDHFFINDHLIKTPIGVRKLSVFIGRLNEEMKKVYLMGVEAVYDELTGQCYLENKTVKPYFVKIPHRNLALLLGADIEFRIGPGCRRILQPNLTLGAATYRYQFIDNDMRDELTFPVQHDKLVGETTMTDSEWLLVRPGSKRNVFFSIYYLTLNDWVTVPMRCLPERPLLMIYGEFMAPE